MNSNKFSNPTRRAVLFALILIPILLLSGCRGRATQPPTPTGTSSPTTAPATQTSAPEDTGAPQTTRPPQGDDTSEPVIEASQPVESGAQPTNTTRATPRPSATVRPVSTYVFPTDEAGMPVYPTDAEGNQVFPTDTGGNPIIATDEAGNPIFPIDLEGNLVIPKNPRGTPLYPTDEFGFPILPNPVDEDLPTDESLPTDEFFPPDGNSFDTPEPGSATLTPRPRPTISFDQPPSDSEPAFPEGTPTPIVWATPATTKPVGDPENPLVIGVVVSSAADLDRVGAMDALAQRLAADTDLTVQVQQTGSYVELLNGMRAGAVHMAWLQPFTYIIAHQRGYADAAMISNHFGLQAYGAMFLANASSDITPFFDERANKNTGTAEEALPQFAGKRACWVDSMSASGYVVPLGALTEQNAAPVSSIFMASHSGVVRALYIQGICDFGAAFALSGDPRTAAVLQNDLPDVMEKVKIIWQTDPVIPSLNLSFMSRLPKDTRVKVVEALLDLVQTGEGKAMLTDANAYDIRDLKEIDDTFYDALRRLLDQSNVNVRTLIGK